MIKKQIITGLACLFLLGTDGCTSDQVAQPEPCVVVKSYDDSIREIVLNKCNFSGCHDGASGVGNYSTYRGMERILENGEFRRQVVVAKAMPQTGSLTEEEFELLKCWSENGYPEN